MTGADAVEKDWRLFDNWDRCFDKLPVISAKLSLRVTGADASRKASASLIFEFASSISELHRVQRLHVTSADKSGKEDWPVVSERAQLLRKLAPLRFFELASSNSELASSISEISSSVDFYRGT